MIGRRPIVGLCMLAALLVSAFAAHSASAVTGTTGTAPAGMGYTGNVTVEGGEFRIHSVISGIEFEIKATSISGSGSAESMVSGSEHTWHEEGTLHWKGVTVIKPSGKGCIVVGETLHHEYTAGSAGLGMGRRFTAITAGGWIVFQVTGCGETEALKALNGTYEVTGSVVGTPTEGTNETVFERTPTTTQGTLKLRGQKAGISGTLKLKTGAGEAIKASTINTP